MTRCACYIHFCFPTRGVSWKLYRVLKQSNQQTQTENKNDEIMASICQFMKLIQKGWALVLNWRGQLQWCNSLQAKNNKISLSSKHKITSQLGRSKKDYKNHPRIPSVVCGFLHHHNKISLCTWRSSSKLATHFY